MSVLEIKNVSVKKPKPKLAKGQSKRLLVDSVSCAINAGEILAIIGPNGAGKSTLLNAIAGDWEFSGEIFFNNKPINNKSLAKQLAVLPQFSLLNFPFRVSEVVGLGRIPHNTGHKLDAEIVQGALELMDIGFLKNRLYTELSGGEKQRVQLARVLAQIWREADSQGPRLLLLDEPSTALDLGHQQDLMQAVAKFAQQGVAVVMVLHDINLATRYANKFLAMQCSQAIAYGDAKTVITQDNMQKLFGLQTDIISHPRYQTPVVLGL